MSHRRWKGAKEVLGGESTCRPRTLSGLRESEKKDLIDLFTDVGDRKVGSHLEQGVQEQVRLTSASLPRPCSQ